MNTGRVIKGFAIARACVAMIFGIGMLWGAQTAKAWDEHDLNAPIVWANPWELTNTQITIHWDAVENVNTYHVTGIDLANSNYVADDQFISPYYTWYTSPNDLVDTHPYMFWVGARDDNDPQSTYYEYSFYITAAPRTLRGAPPIDTAGKSFTSRKNNLQDITITKDNRNIVTVVVGTRKAKDFQVRSIKVSGTTSGDTVYLEWNPPTDLNKTVDHYRVLRESNRHDFLPDNGTNPELIPKPFNDSIRPPQKPNNPTDPIKFRDAITNKLNQPLTGSTNYYYVVAFEDAEEIKQPLAVYGIVTCTRSHSPASKKLSPPTSYGPDIRKR